VFVNRRVADPEAVPHAAKQGSREMAQTHFPSLVHCKREEEKRWTTGVRSRERHASSITSPQGATSLETGP
jgi:hypothetical protein